MVKCNALSLMVTWDNPVNRPTDRQTRLKPLLFWYRITIVLGLENAPFVIENILSRGSVLWCSTNKFAKFWM